jgi:hypothetical protein
MLLMPRRKLTAHTILRHMEFHHTELFFLLFIHVETHRCLRFRLAERNGEAIIVHLLAFASVGSEERPYMAPAQSHPLTSHV